MPRWYDFLFREDPEDEPVTEPAKPHREDCRGILGGNKAHLRFHCDNKGCGWLSCAKCGVTIDKKGRWFER